MRAGAEGQGDHGAPGQEGRWTGGQGDKRAGGAGPVACIVICRMSRQGIV